MAQYFPIDKWRALQLAMMDGNINNSAKVVFARLLEHHNTKTGLCCPSQFTLAHALNTSDRTIRDALRQLEKNKYVKTKRNDGLYGSNGYELTIPTGKFAYQVAEKKRLEERKKPSAKPKKEPKKKPLAKEEANEAQKSLPSTRAEIELAEKVRGQLEEQLVVQLGGGAKAWEKVLEMTELEFETYVEKILHRECSLLQAANEILKKASI